MRKILLFVFAIFIAFNIQAQNSTNKGTSFTIYPNPTTEFIMIDDYDENLEQIVVYNLVGRKVRTFDTIANKKYSLADLPNGLYLVQLVNNNNKVLTTQRVKKR